MGVNTAFIEDVGVEDRHESHGNVVVEEVELDEPKENEVLVDIKAAGVCHSDYHVATGDLGAEHLPMALGHEGAGVIEETGEGVAKVEEGDHVTLSWIPSCGNCPACASGKQNLCVRIAQVESGQMINGGFRMQRQNGEDVGQILFLGCYSEKIVVHEDSVVPIPEDVPFDVAGVTGCCVPTGYGAAVNQADIEPGDTVVHFGFGGVGANAVQGSAAQGASEVIVVDPNENKHELAEEFGATHTVNPDARDPREFVEDLTHGRMADVAIYTGSVGTAETLGEAYRTIGAQGQLISVASCPTDVDHIDLPLDAGGANQFTFQEREIRGTVYGGWSPSLAVPHLLELYEKGDLEIGELITRRYELDEINDAFDDMLAGENIRGVIEF